MTSEKKFKDLMARLVAMSPQPPVFPEEILMTQPTNEPRRSPVLIFAVAAAAVLALGLPFLLFQGGGGDPVATSVPSPVTTIPSAAPTSTLPASTSIPGTETTLPVAVEVGGTIYLVQEPGNSFTGNPALVPFEVSYTDETNALRGIDQPVLLLTQLADLGVTLPEGFETVIPAGIDGVHGGVDDSDPAVITMYMNEAFLEGAGGLLADITMLNQIIYTVTQEDPEALVQFIVNDAPVEAYGTEGLSLVEPVGRDTFLDHLNPIILTRAAIVEGGMSVGGRANVFEATIQYRVTESPISGFTTATCGTGCWGDFGFVVGPGVEITESAVLEVFTDSAQDGSAIYVISVPFFQLFPLIPWDLNP